MRIHVYKARFTKKYKKSKTNKNEMSHGMAHVCHRVNFGMKVLTSIFGNYLHMCTKAVYFTTMKLFYNAMNYLKPQDFK